MRRKIFPVVLALAGLGNSSGFAASSSTNVLIERLKRLEQKGAEEQGTSKRQEIKEIILQLGDSGDESVKPILKKYLQKTKSRRLSTPAGAAQVALAKFDDDAFSEVLEELSPKQAALTQEEAFSKLGIIGNRKAIAALAGYLKDDSAPSVGEPEGVKPPPPGMRRQGVIKFQKRGMMAAQALAKIIKDRPTETRPEFYTDDDLRKWREWWEKNKAQYK